MTFYSLEKMSKKINKLVYLQQVHQEIAWHWSCDEFPKQPRINVDVDEFPSKAGNEQKCKKWKVTKNKYKKTEKMQVKNPLCSWKVV